MENHLNPTLGEVISRFHVISFTDHVATVGAKPEDVASAFPFSKQKAIIRSGPVVITLCEAPETDYWKDE